VRIDGLQYGRWSREIFQQMREGGLDAVHATVAYHEGFRETARLIADWGQRFRDHADLILPAREAADIARAVRGERTAIFLGLQTPMPIEDDIGLIEILHQLGIRFFQLTYNNQSLLGCGWQEAEDSGVTRMGREAIAELNRLGMVIDLSHAGERTALQAIGLSRRPVAVSHANPAWLRATRRNVSRDLLSALRESGGFLGLSLYPHHLPGGSETSLDEFGRMAAEAAECIGPDRLGIGSDLCQDQPDDVVRWMREGRWTRPKPGEAPRFPAPLAWHRDNRDFPRIAGALAAAGFSPAQIDGVMGENWRRFIEHALKPSW